MRYRLFSLAVMLGCTISLSALAQEQKLATDSRPTPAQAVAIQSTTPLIAPAADVSLVPYQLHVKGPHDAEDSVTLLLPTAFPVHYNQVKEVSYLKSVCTVEASQAMPKVANASRTASGTSSDDPDCAVDPQNLEPGTSYTVMEPGVITAGLQITLTRLSLKQVDYLRVAVVNRSLLSLSSFTDHGITVQLPKVGENSSIQIYPTQKPIHLDLGFGWTADIKRLPH